MSWLFELVYHAGGVEIFPEQVYLSLGVDVIDEADGYFVFFADDGVNVARKGHFDCFAHSTMPASIVPTFQYS